MNCPEQHAQGERERRQESERNSCRGLFERRIDGEPTHGELLVACGWQLLNGMPATLLADELRRAGLRRMAMDDRVYSETETQFWLRVVQRVLRLNTANGGAAGWSTIRQELLAYADRRDLPLQYYNAERWYSPLARYRWLRPDRRNFPRDGLI